MDLSELVLGEPLITDLLHPSPTIPAEQLQQDREYMRKLLEYMKKNGRPPRTQRIDVNTKGEVIGGNHRTLAAWLLRWTHIDATSVDAVAGFHVPLDEMHRKPLEELLGLFL